MNNLKIVAEPSSSEFVAFRLGTQEFGIDIISVREIRCWTPTTPLPRAPMYVRGVINLRGAVLPVIDLAQLLGLAVSEPSPSQVIIVVQIGGRIAGLLVDAVSDILAVMSDDIKQTPDVASSVAKTFVLGIVVMDDRMISILSLANITQILDAS